MRFRKLPPREVLQEVFEYRDGSIYWRKKVCDRTVVGARAGFDSDVGTKRRIVGLFGKKWYEYRIIAAMHGMDVSGEIDHIDRDSMNNRIENLRPSTRSANAINRGLQSNNKSGHVGVSWDARSGKWYAYIKRNGVMKNLGLYAQKNAALAARKKAENGE